MNNLRSPNILSNLFFFFAAIVYLTGYTPAYASSEYCDNQEKGFEEENDFQQVQEDLYPPEGDDEYIQEHQKDDIMSGM